MVNIEKCKMAESSEYVTKNDDEYARFVPPFGGLTVAVERCPLCSMTRKPFTCQKCVERGNFTHSNGRNPERYSYFFFCTKCMTQNHEYRWTNNCVIKYYFVIAIDSFLFSCVYFTGMLRNFRGSTGLERKG